MKDLGLSQKLINSVADIMKGSIAKKAEESKAVTEKMSSHYGKMGAVKPLSNEEARQATFEGKAAQRRVAETIAQVHSKSIAETNAQAEKDNEYIKRQYSKAGGVQPISEKTEMAKAETPASKTVKSNPLTDPYASGTLKSRKSRTQADVSDEVQHEGDVIDEARFKKGQDIGKPGMGFKKIAAAAAKRYGSKEAGQRVAGAVLKKVLAKEEQEVEEQTTPKTAKEKKLAAMGHPKDKITHKDVLIGRGVITKEEKDTPGNGYEHQCALHVKHSKLGEGKTLFSQHAEPAEDGTIEWYDVMFEHGIEKKVPTMDLEILISESHMNHKKKK